MKDNGAASEGQNLELAAAMVRNMPRNLPSGMAQYWIKNQAELAETLQEALLSQPPKFPVWKTIRLGTGLKTANDFRRALETDGFKIGKWANDIIGRPSFTVATQKTEIELIRVCTAELGFNNGATCGDIYRQALRLGLKPCPNEVAPQLRLQYNNQPNDECLNIAMEPIIDFDAYPRIFSVQRHCEKFLYSCCGSPGYFWDNNSQWIFVRYKF